MPLKPYLVPYKGLLLKTRTVITTFDNPSMSNCLFSPHRAAELTPRQRVINTYFDQCSVFESPWVIKTYFVQCFSLHDRGRKMFNVVL